MHDFEYSKYDLTRSIKLFHPEILDILFDLLYKKKIDVSFTSLEIGFIVFKPFTVMVDSPRH